MSASDVPSGNAGALPDFVVPDGSPEDTSEYRRFLLPNGIDVVVVSDSKADNCAAAVSNAVGTFQDPTELAGLAHFCEHMLFMGSEKFPSENEYSKFINDHGGRHNAYTDTEQTVYFFQINNGFLKDGLDRLSQFFVAPVFREDAVGREVIAVHDEYTKNLQDDNWRFYALDQVTSGPGHPYSRFDIGNKETLQDAPKRDGINPRDALLEWYKKNYSANLMSVVIVGPESVEQLSEWAVEFFGPVENRDLTIPVCTDPPAHPPSAMKKRINAVPVKELRSLSINWALPPVSAHYTKKPAGHLSHLIGHEGVGSILWLLKEKKWANGLSSYCYPKTKSFASFQTSIELTPEGLEHVDEILAIVYQYIALMREASTDTWRKTFDELAAVQKMQFRFREREQPMGLAVSLVASMHLYPAAHTLSGPYLLEDFDPELIRSFVALLTPENMKIVVAGKEFEGTTDQTEQFFKVEYSISELDDALCARLSAPSVAPADLQGLALPQPNPFIATNFDLVPIPAGTPVDTSDAFPSPPLRLLQTERAELWYKLDTQFRKPKAAVRVRFLTPAAVGDAEALFFLSVLDKYAKFVLDDFAYDAAVADLHYWFSARASGLVTTFTGYNDKLGVLAGRVFQVLGELAQGKHIEPDRFALIQEKILRAYRSHDKHQPHKWAVYNREACTVSDHVPVDQMIVAATAATVEGFAAFAARFFAKGRVETFAMGNLDQAAATAFHASAVDALTSASPAGFTPLPRAEFPQLRVVALPEQHEFTFSEGGRNPQDPNNAVQVTLQVGPRSDRQLAAKLQMLSNLLQERFFNQLRTIESCGYLVWTHVTDSRGLLGLGFTAQSPKYTAEKLDERIEAFLHAMKAELHRVLLTPEGGEEFASVRQALIDTYKTKDTSMDAEASRHWEEIRNHLYMFDRREQTIAAVEALTPQEIYDFFISDISLDGAKRKRFASRVVASPEAAAVAADAAGDAEEAEYDLEKVIAALKDLGLPAEAVDLLQENPERAMMAAKQLIDAGELEAEDLLPSAAAAAAAGDEDGDDAAEKPKPLPLAPETSATKVVISDPAAFVGQSTLHPPMILNPSAEQQS